VSGPWSARTSWETVCARAAGRRRYHAERQALQAKRWAKIICRLPPHPWPRGLQSALARELGVSRGTISRDFAALASVDSLPLLRKRINYVARFCGPRDSDPTGADRLPDRPAVAWASLSAVELLRQVEALDYRLLIQDGQLVLRANADRPAELLQARKAHAAELRKLVSPAPAAPTSPEHGAPLRGCAIRQPTAGELDLLRMLGIFGR